MKSANGAVRTRYSYGVFYVLDKLRNRAIAAARIFLTSAMTVCTGKQPESSCKCLASSRRHYLESEADETQNDFCDNFKPVVLTHEFLKLMS